ncbi:M13 family metallopeptidase [Frateuria aurantia]
MKWGMTKGLSALIALGLASTAVQAAERIGGIDVAGMDRQVQPGNDFEAYANGGWRKTAQIPAAYPMTGVFLDVYKESVQRTGALVRGAAAAHPAADSNAGKVAADYAAFMNTAAIERSGLQPLQAQHAAIESVHDVASLSALFGSQLRADVDPINATHFHTSHLFGLFVAQNLSDPSHELGYLLQGGLALPDRDYYLSPTPAMAAIRNAYLGYVTALLKTAGVAQPASVAREVVDLETRIAQAQVSLVQSQDVHAVSAAWPLASFAQQAPGIDWPAFFEAAGLSGQPALAAWQPQAVKQLSALVTEVPLATWKHYLWFEALNRNASLLPKAYADLSFGFFGKTLSGVSQQRPRDQRAVEAVSGDLSDAVGQLYVKQYFPASSKAAVQALVGNLLKAFNARIDGLTWMTPATRAHAKAKIATLKVGVGYPEHWRDYAGLEIDPKDALGNHLRAETFEYHYQLAKLDRPADRGEWWMSPQTVNAVNLPLQNALNFPAAILVPPFFDPKADPAANYGAIGAIIGHEISHSFDNTGAEFDENGKLANWWTPADQAHFKAASQKLVQQYDAYQVLPGLHVNGQQTLGENIADVSGLTIAWLAYRHALHDQPAPMLGGMTGDQRFFLAFAQAWRSKEREQALRQGIATDVHAPAAFRAETVRNIDAWYQAFDIKPGQQLYLAPQDRVKIW